jgi:hypothetical protein
MPFTDHGKPKGEVMVNLFTRDAARKFIADQAIEAAVAAVKAGKPEWAQTLTIQVEVKADIAEAAARED